MKNNNVNEKKTIIMRKMGAGEVIYDHEQSLGNCFLVHAFKIKTSINLKENRPLIEKAIVIWKQINPLLSSKIITIQSEDSVSSEKYFAFVDYSKRNVCDNLKILSLKSESDDSDAYWRLLFDYEMNKEFIDTNNGLLWRILIVCNHLNAENNTTYWVIFTVHHAIVDVNIIYIISFGLSNLYTS